MKIFIGILVVSILLFILFIFAALANNKNYDDGSEFYEDLFFIEDKNKDKK